MRWSTTTFIDEDKLFYSGVHMDTELFGTEYSSCALLLGEPASGRPEDDPRVSGPKPSIPGRALLIRRAKEKFRCVSLVLSGDSNRYTQGKFGDFR